MEEERRKHKRKRLHLDVVESVRLSQSEEGTASLRQPVDRTHPQAPSNQAMMPRFRNRGKFRPPRRVETPDQDKSSTASNSAQGSKPEEQTDSWKGKPVCDVESGHDEVLQEGECRQSWTDDSCLVREQPCASASSHERKSLLQPCASASTSSSHEMKSLLRPCASASSCEVKSRDKNVGTQLLSTLGGFQPASSFQQQHLSLLPDSARSMVTPASEQSSASGTQLLSTLGGFQPASSHQQHLSSLPKDSSSLVTPEQSSARGTQRLSGLGSFQPASSLQQRFSLWPDSASLMTPPPRNPVRFCGQLGSKKAGRNQRLRDFNQSSIRSFMSGKESPSSSSSYVNVASAEPRVSDRSGNASPSIVCPLVSGESKEYPRIVTQESSPDCSPGETLWHRTTSTSEEKPNFDIRNSVLPGCGEHFGISSDSDNKEDIIKRKNGVYAASSTKRRGKFNVKRSVLSKSGDKTCSNSGSHNKKGDKKRKRSKCEADLNQTTLTSVSSILCISNPGSERDNDVVVINDDEDLADPSPWVPSVRLDIDVGATFGLLNDSEVEVVRQNWFLKLPPEVLVNVLCRLPMVDLCLSVSRVCVHWNNVVSSSRFMPWKKLYHRLKKGDRESEEYNSFYQSLVDRSMLRPCLTKLIRNMKTLMGPSRYNNACDILKSHPKHKMALILMEEKAPECFVEGKPTPWCLVCSVVMVSSTVEDIHRALRLLTSARSQLPCEHALEGFYCMAAFLLHWKYTAPQTEALLNPRDDDGVLHRIDFMSSMGTSVERDLHYRVFYALYLFENSFMSTQAMLQEAVKMGTGQQSLVKYRAVCEQARARFPPNVVCKTGHGLAFKTTGWRYASKEQLNTGDISKSSVDEVMKKSGLISNKPYHYPDLVAATVTNFLQSDDERIRDHHAVPTAQNSRGTMNFFSLTQESADEFLLKVADLYWNCMKDVDVTQVKMTHDGYLKLFQLRKPQLKGYDMILIDEAQDLSPPLLDVLKRQRQPRIFVGDQHQQIYRFRGAVNALDRVKADKVFYLTQSLRFGPEIAQVANTILENCKNETAHTLVGHATPGCISGETVGQVAVLCRTNYDVFKLAVTYCDTVADPTAKIAFVGGLDTLQLGKLVNASGSREKRGSGCFKGIDGKRDDPVEQLPLVANSFGMSLHQCVRKIVARTIDNIRQADVVFSTFHKSKGLEFSSVRIVDDLIINDHHRASLFEHSSFSVREEDMNLLYVAVTRAKHSLLMTSMLREWHVLLGGGCYHPRLTEELKGEGVRMRCVSRAVGKFTPKAITVYRPPMTVNEGWQGIDRRYPPGVVSPAAHRNDGHRCLFGKGKETEKSEDDDFKDGDLKDDDLEDDGDHSIKDHDQYLFPE
ncbi:hypothetical protein ACOMHN_015042 [Nucella lapillus]